MASKITCRGGRDAKDRNGQRIKGNNASASHIDEADELSLMFTTAKSRKGRRNTNGQPSIAIITNLNDVEHIKEVYMRWKLRRKTASMSHCHRIFAWSSFDGLIHGKCNQTSTMMTNPTWWVEALQNNWEYQERAKTISARVFFAKASRATSQTQRHPATTCDGVDRSVAADWENPDTD